MSQSDQVKEFKAQIVQLNSKLIQIEKKSHLNLIMLFVLIMKSMSLRF